jgi:hypothetical protein
MPAFSLAVALTGALASTAAAQPVNSVSVHLIRRCQPAADCLRAGTVRRMTDETTRIWSSLDVRIDWIDSAAQAAPGARADVTVLLEESARPNLAWRVRGGVVLAAIHQPAVPCGPGLARLWVTQARRHAASIRLHGIPFASLPHTLADLFLARSLGRALAHEIGHYLLPATGHTSRGLMRAHFAPQELLEPLTQERYGLDRRDREALRSCHAHQGIPVASY